MTRTLIATGAAAALMLSTALVAQQGRRPASPTGTAATEIGGKYDTSGAEQHAAHGRSDPRHRHS